jgi:radical SAM superfamily enzyme YgiQ (UPF0313 family)
MNVTLCSVPVETPGGKLRRKRSEGSSPIQPKIAISSLDNWSKKHGFNNTKFFDIDMLYPDDDFIENYFRETKPDVVGLSAVVSTSYLQVKRLAKIIKKVNPGTLIVCGGYLTAAANTILRKTDVDLCVVGDGEVAWVGILEFVKDHIKSGRNKMDIDKLLEVKGIAILDKNTDDKPEYSMEDWHMIQKKEKTNEDDILRFSGYGKRLSTCDMSFPDFDYLKSGLLGDDEALQNHFRHFTLNENFIMDERSFEKGRRPYVTSINTSKGCVARCTFCQRGSKGYTTYDLDKLEKFILELKKYDVGFLDVSDENFSSNIVFTRQVAELFHKHDFLWQAMGVRCDSVTKEDIKFFKDHGCTTIKFGIESGSQRMLDIMEKKFTVEDIKKAIFACFDIGLYSPPMGFMVGMPGENLQTCKESGKLMGELAAHIGVPPKRIFEKTDILYAIPLVGTPLYEYGRKLGLIGDSVDSEEKYLEMVSNVGAYKRYYINFNGAPMSEVIMWDIQVFMEATRTYYKLRGNKKENKEWSDKYFKQSTVQSNNPHIKAKYQEGVGLFGGGSGDDKTHSKVDPYFITNFVKKYIFSKWMTYIPSFILDNVVRLMLYFEYTIQKRIFKDQNNLHRITNAKVNEKIRIKDEEINFEKTRQIERSLRSIVKKRLLNKQPSPQEKVLSSLTFGP